MIDEALVNAIDRALVAVGLSLWGCEWVGGIEHRILRIYIDSAESGVSVNDCAIATKQVASMLNVEGLIKFDYGLEVSSPGIDRRFFKLEHYKMYVGRKIKCKLRQKIDGDRVIKGFLLEVGVDQIRVDSDGDIKTMLISDIERANLFE